jgi:L-ascorbate metabolism protein UlaG (beta-lactamase superfamily)
MTEIEKYTSKTPTFSFLTMLKWIIVLLTREKREKKYNSKYFQILKKETLVAPIEKGKLRISWLGHSTVLLQCDDGTNIILDPIFQKRIQYVTPRTTGIPIPPADLPHIDMCLISHDHYDHLDTKSLREAKPDVIIAGTKMKTAISSKHKVRELDWWQSVKIKDMEITFVPAKHWSKRGLEKRNKRLWGGFVIKLPSRTIYYSGDTAYCDIAEKIKEKFGKIDLAILPIGCYEPAWIMEFHTNPEQAFEIYKTLGAKYFLPVHWGTYDLSDESAYDPIERIQKLFAKENQPGNLLALPVGGTIEI